MASAERFGLYPCSFGYGASSTLNLTQMQGFSLNPAAQITTIHASGAIDPKANIEVFSDPRIRFATRDLTTYFGAVSATVGLALNSNGATFRLQERSAQDGVFETGSTHETYTVAQGFLYPVSIGAQQDDTNGALIESELCCEYNGSVVPIVKNTGVDFSGASSPAFTSEFWLGPAYVNGSEIAGVISSRVDFGITYSPRRTSGQIYATKGAITQRLPRLSLTILKADAVSALNIFHRALAGTVAFYYWKGTASGNRVAVATTSHCKVSAAAGSWNEQSISVQDNDDATVEISIMPTGTLSVSVASAIP